MTIYKVKARKNSGSEGFLIIFNYQDANNFIWWNCGGWGNTQDAVERCVNGNKTTIDPKSFSVTTGQWYNIEVDVKDGQVTCKLDGNTVHTFSLPVERSLYQSVQLDSVNNQLVVKVVNPSATDRTVALNLKNMEAGTATVQRLVAASGADENTMDDPDNVKPTEVETANVGQGKALTLSAPAYSLSIYRINVSNVADAAATTYPAYEKEDEGKAAYLFAHMSSKESSPATP